MKLATFILDGRERVGIVDVDAGRVHPLTAPGMLDVIATVGADMTLADRANESIALADVQLLAPIPRPARNIFCVGKNYRAHAMEFASSGYEAGSTKGSEVDPYPAVFTKPASTVVGPDAAVDLHPAVTAEVDYEGELAVIIGRGGRNIRRGDALAHVFGYTIVNDVTARDRQKNHKQWFLGKALDTFCPMGPWIVTADELDVANMDIETRVNDEVRQRANTRDLIFDVPSLIETMSAGLTLQPGDIIATGTPAGVGIGFNPPRFLRDGDVVSVAIAGIGVMTNTFRNNVSAV